MFPFGPVIAAGLARLAISTCFLLALSGTVAMAALPVITTPLQPQTVLAGSTVTFTVVAESDSPLSYWWRRNGQGIIGAPNSDTLTLSNVLVSASISVIISNATGGVTSAPVILTVQAPPSIISQPTSRTVNIDAPVSFSVTASGTAPLKYQWRFNDANVPGAITPTFAIAHAQETNAGAYVVVVTNAFGMITSSVATLSINPAPTGGPPSIITAPQPQTVLAGSTVAFTVVAAGDSPLFYFWRRDGSNIWGSPDGDTLTLPNVRVSAAISVLVSNAAGTVVAGPAALTVNSPPLITSQPSGVTVMPGGQASFNVMVSGDAPLTYQWRFNETNIPGATGQNWIIAGAQDADAGGYSVFVSNTFGMVTSAVATLTVDPTAYLHWAWARKVAGPFEQWAQAVAVGTQGEVYVAGRFIGLTDFGGQTLSPSGGKDVFLARYDPSGGLVWVRRAGDGKPHLSGDAVGVAVDLRQYRRGWECPRPGDGTNLCVRE